MQNVTNSGLNVCKCFPLRWETNTALLFDLQDTYSTFCISLGVIVDCKQTQVCLQAHRELFNVVGSNRKHGDQTDMG